MVEESSLVLPDNTKLEARELYFEGKLLSFHREVAVVFVSLDRPDASNTANGDVVYLNRPAVIFQGPATVQLHQEHFIERIPTDEKFYWSHLRATGLQFNLPLDD